MCKYKLMLGRACPRKARRAPGPYLQKGAHTLSHPNTNTLQGPLGKTCTDLFTSSSLSVGAFPSELQCQGCASTNPHTSFGGLAGNPEHNR